MEYRNRLGVSELLFRQCEPWHARLAAVEAHLTDYGRRSSAFLGELAIGMVDRFEDLLAECHSLTEELRTLKKPVDIMEGHVLRLLDWESYNPMSII